ncbi:hypothetical protein L198_04862 [Cryptococcus wingfieldii CBS 7118]|uniref:Uncharacterized protein n=1 Tax=Cryptococcus wingfieldii CBS 7118 TaxID=1295528 RepID=A0A1E3J1J2_9TREE|nr:hypothetical protein L198_04862 [Cryptococcus wingfieldii CBS 7118]ODN94719.1 hypothetical protein L198_04862 [Cryptococcus wingfieldii CBS 7118]
MYQFPPGLSLHDAFFFLPPEVRAIVTHWFTNTPFTQSDLARMVRINKHHYAHFIPELYNAISLDRQNCETFFYPLINDTHDPREALDRHRYSLTEEWSKVNHGVTFIPNAAVRKLACLSCVQRVVLAHTDAVMRCKEAAEIAWYFNESDESSDSRGMAYSNSKLFPAAQWLAFGDQITQKLNTYFNVWMGPVIDLCGSEMLPPVIRAGISVCFHTKSSHKLGWEDDVLRKFSILSDVKDASLHNMYPTFVPCNLEQFERLRVYLPQEKPEGDASVIIEEWIKALRDVVTSAILWMARRGFRIDIYNTDITDIRAILANLEETPERVELWKEILHLHDSSSVESCPGCGGI